MGSKILDKKIGNAAHKVHQNKRKQNQRHTNASMKYFAVSRRRERIWKNLPGEKNDCTRVLRKRITEAREEKRSFFYSWNWALQMDKLIHSPFLTRKVPKVWGVLGFQIERQEKESGKKRWRPEKKEGKEMTVEKNTIDGAGELLLITAETEKKK
jgi:hypothetical protein